MHMAAQTYSAAICCRMRGITYAYLLDHNSYS